MTSAIHYRESDLRVLASLEGRHFWFGARRRILIDAIGRHFPGARSYLEIGAGTGYNAQGIAAAFPKLRVVASDPLSGPLHIDIRDIPFDSAFDLIGAYDVLEHVEDDAAAVGQLYKACRPGGGVLLTVPQHSWLWSPADSAAQHYRRYAARGLKKLLRRAGFEIVGATSFQTATLVPFAVRALTLRLLHRAPTGKAPARPLNWILGCLMDLDGAAIRAHIPLPIGASLLIAARKPAAKVDGGRLA